MKILFQIVCSLLLATTILSPRLATACCGPVSNDDDTLTQALNQQFPTTDPTQRDQLLSELAQLPKAERRAKIDEAISAGHLLMSMVVLQRRMLEVAAADVVDHAGNVVVSSIGLLGTGILGLQLNKIVKAQNARLFTGVRRNAMPRVMLAATLLLGAADAIYGGYEVNQTIMSWDAYSQMKLDLRAVATALRNQIDFLKMVRDYEETNKHT